MINNPIKNIVSRREGVVPIVMIIAVVAVVAIGAYFAVNSFREPIGKMDFAFTEPPSGLKEAACPGDRGIACEVPKTPVCKDGKWICVGPAEPSGIIAPGVSGSGGAAAPTSGAGSTGSAPKPPAVTPTPTTTPGTSEPASPPSETGTPSESTTTVEAPPPQPPQPQEHIVIYTDDGFSPSPLTIKVGETVMFKSQGSRTMWVASDPHPTHTDDRDFDAHRGYGPGEVYSYTFTEAGTWGYHNHLNPGLRGKIIVE